MWFFYVDFPISSPQVLRNSKPMCQGGSLFSCFLMALFSGCAAITYACELVSIKTQLQAQNDPFLTVYDN